jgi:flavin-dependent dehydrogenase
LFREAGLSQWIGLSGDTGPRPLALDRFELRFRGRALRLPLPEGVALSRARLDAALAGAAAAAGATVSFETQAVVEGVQEGTRTVRLIQRGETSHVRAKVVLNAAGLGGNCLSQHAAPRLAVAAGSRVGAGCLIQDVPAGYGGGTIFMAAGRRGYVGFVRVEDHTLNVAAAFDADFVRSHGSPGLAAESILGEAGFPAVPGLSTADWRGTLPLTRRVHPLADDRLFLLGDAAGYVEPFTGEGMAWAVASGLAVAPLALRAIQGWTTALVREWASRHSQLVGRRQRVCRAASLVLRTPWMMPLGFETLARWPAGSAYLLHRLNASSLVPSR